MSSRVLALPLIALISIAALAGCGESKEDKANAKVCDARDDIAKQVDTLKGLTITTASISQVSDGIKAIGDDLNEIVDAESELSDSRRDQVKEANAAFSASVKQIASGLGTTTSLQQAATQIGEAGKKLAQSYEDTYAKLDCS